MREPTRRRAAALGGAVLLATALAAPAVLAQDNSGVSNPADWEGSRFTSPTGTVSEEAFAISGVFTKVRQTAERITQVDVSFDDGGPTDAAPSPSDPTGVESTDCVPDDPPPIVRDPSAGNPDDPVDRFEFEVAAEDSVWPCNGRYTVVAAGQSNQEVAPYEISTVISVAVPPAPITVVNARWDGDVEAVEVIFEPLGEDELAVDAIGYRVERAGPDGGDAFAPVGDDLGVDDEPVVLDTPGTGGDYRYRVRAIRAGPDGPVLSVAAASAVAEVTVPGEVVETTTTTTATRSGTVGSGGRRSGVVVTRGGGASRPSGPPTTADTGFDETIDYGDRRPRNELAGQEEGQSIIRTEGGEGAGLVAPVAGALVLLGWAGHIAYLNRLAKQF